MTNMIVENWDRGTPSDSTEVLAGQSQISRGMIVLRASRQAAVITAKPQNGLYGVLCDAHCGLKIECLPRLHIIE